MTVINEFNDCCQLQLNEVVLKNHYKNNSLD